MTAAGAHPPAAGRPPRDQRLRPYVDNGVMWRTFMTLAGMGHAGDDASPRPLPQTSLYEFKHRCAAGAPSGTGPVPEALYFAFYADRYRVPPEQAITVPAEHLWWLALEQDHVLLSDRVTHHYTRIAAVNRGEDRIRFDDFWPEDFFLLPGRNTLGIAARLDHGLSVSKDEFIRAAVGLVTWDTPPLVEHYLDAFPEQRANAGVLLRFGLALLDAEADLLAPLAAMLCADAVRHATDDEARAMAARQAYLAAACSAYLATGPEPELLSAMQGILHLVVSPYGREALESGLSPKELARLAHRAIQASDFGAAGKILDRAVAADPEFEDGYGLRASARVNAGDAAGATLDAARALDLNARALARLAAERAALDPRGRSELQWKDRQIGGRRRRRERELDTLLAACVALGDFSRARTALQAAIVGSSAPQERARYDALLADLETLERQRSSA